MVCAMLWGAVMAQEPVPSGLREFKVYVPQGKIVQGDKVQVVYELEAKNYSVKSFDGKVECARLTALESEKLDTDGYKKIRIKATFTILGAGNLQVYPMSAVVDNRTVYSDKAVIMVQPHPEWGDEWETAYRFLLRKGAQPAQLAYRFRTETMCAFSDDKGKCFAIVVSGEYSRYIDNPVLAYGTENSMWDGKNQERENTIQALLDGYGSQLRHLRQNSQVYSSLNGIAHDTDSKKVQPLLKNISLGQDYPYNILFPKEKYGGKDSLCVAGCGPVALAQVLEYYRHPVNPVYDGEITTRSGKLYRISKTGYPVNWDGSDRDRASLMLNCAGSLMAETSPAATSSSLSDFKAALLGYWGYSPVCRMYKDIDDYSSLNRIYSEIDCGRPVIVSDDTHIFICDGYDGDYLHLNMGWKGLCDGYYRAVVVSTMNENQLPFNEILVGIEPLSGEQVRTVHVETPGTLSQLLGNDRNVVNTLVVTGTINGDDIVCLRSMAGAIDSVSLEKGPGSLMNLDLSGTVITGGECYLVRRADGIILKGYQSDASGSFSYNYNMSQISELDWAEISRRGINKLDHVTLLKGSDGHYYASYQAVDYVIGEHMFSNCENLVNIALPLSTRQIDNYAFLNCNSLRTVYNEPSTVSETAYRNCRFLK